MPHLVDRHVKALARSYSQVVFASGPGVGVVLFLATLFNPNVAASGVAAVLAAYIFARLINFDPAYLDLGHYTFNPLLAGMAVGYVFKITDPASILIITSAGILAFVIAVIASGSLTRYMSLSVLSLPFALASVIVYLAAPRIPGFNPAGFYPDWDAAFSPALPLWLEGFFKSFGMIFFLPHVIPGIIIAAVVLCVSRILFMTAAVGYFAGTLAIGLLTGSVDAAFADPYHFNFIVIAMALGAVFNIPSLKSYAIAVVAVCAAALLQKALAILLAFFAVPVFSLPFNMIVMAFLFTLGSAYYKNLTKYFMATPEETLDHFLAVSRRFKYSERTIYMPFSGNWTVWQGFDGEWTHKAEQRFAYDFLIVGENGKTHDGGGGQLDDYFAFRKSVLAPGRGRVVKVISGLPDNPIGQVDKENTWGNFVIMYDERGFYVAVSHLMKDSVAVTEGEWVERGAFLGKCGNSGYSPQPHIHIQAQKTDSISSATLPFSFICYSEGERFQANDLPRVGAVVEPLFEDKGLAAKTSFMLGDRFTFEVLENGKKTGHVRLAVKSAEDGTFYFDSGKGKLFFGKFEGTLYAYRVEGADKCLNAMFLALPRMPLGWKNKLSWSDYVPANMAYGGLRSGLLMFASSFHHNLASIKTELAYKDQDTIEGRVVTNIFRLEKEIRVELDEHIGFKTIKAGQLELRRLNYEAVRG